MNYDMEDRILREFIEEDFELWLKEISNKYTLDADHLGYILTRIIFDGDTTKIEGDANNEI